MTVVREQRVQFFEGFIARDAARLHTSDGEPAAALGLFADAITAFQRAGNVPQLDHHAGQRARAVRAARPSRAGRDAARRARERAVERPPRPRARRPRRPDRTRRWDRKRAEQLTGDGRRSTSATPPRYARQQIEVARRDPSPRHARGRPGGLSRREVEVLRLLADGKTAGRDRGRAVHLEADRRAPHPAHLHEDRRLQPRRGDPLGRRAPASSKAPSAA